MTKALLTILLATIAGFVGGLMVRWIYLGETMVQTWHALSAVLTGTS